MEAISLKPIGWVSQGPASPGQAPRQGPEAGQESLIELDPAWAPALEGLEPGRDLWVLYHFHLAGPPRLLAHPRGDHSRPPTGLFNTRTPRRPCPLGLTLVRLLSKQGHRLRVRGLEAVAGTLDQPRPQEEP